MRTEVECMSGRRLKVDTDLREPNFIYIATVDSSSHLLSSVRLSLVQAKELRRTLKQHLRELKGK